MNSNTQKLNKNECRFCRESFEFIKRWPRSNPMFCSDNCADQYSAKRRRMKASLRSVYEQEFWYKRKLAWVVGLTKEGR